MEAHDPRPLIAQKVQVLALGLQTGGEPPAPTRPNHEPLRGPRGAHIKQLGFFALVFARGGHVARAHQPAPPPGTPALCWRAWSAP